MGRSGRRGGHARTRTGAGIFFDILERRQAGFISQALDLVRRRRPGEREMTLPCPGRIGQIGMQIGAVKHVAGAARVHHPVGRHRERGARAHHPGLVIPEQSALPHGHAADAATAAFQIVQHLGGSESHLLAQPRRHDGHVDEGQKIVRICTKPAAVERGEDSGRPTPLGIMDGGVGLVPVHVQGAATGEIEQRKRIEMRVVAAAHDRAPAVLRHDERERGRSDVPGMDRDRVFRGHLQEHAVLEPVVRDSRGADPARSRAWRSRRRR